jgi:cytoskeletal protein CcmA (bactofilin family)
MFRTGQRSDHPAKAEPPAQPAATTRPAVDAAERDEAVAVVAPRSAGLAGASLGRGVRFDGSLRFSGTMRIDDGAVAMGKITAGDVLLVGETGTVAANVTCGSIEVRGEARGSLTARESIELRASSRVAADVSTPSLVIEKGARFEGSVKIPATQSSLRR